MRQAVPVGLSHAVPYHLSPRLAVTYCTCLGITRRSIARRGTVRVQQVCCCATPSGKRPGLRKTDPSSSVECFCRTQLSFAPNQLGVRYGYNPQNHRLPLVSHRKALRYRYFRKRGGGARHRRRACRQLSRTPQLTRTSRAVTLHAPRRRQNPRGVIAAWHSNSIARKGKGVRRTPSNAFTLDGVRSDFHSLETAFDGEATVCRDAPACAPPPASRSPNRGNRNSPPPGRSLRAP